MHENLRSVDTSFFKEGHYEQILMAMEEYAIEYHSKFHLLKEEF